MALGFGNKTDGVSTPPVATSEKHQKDVEKDAVRSGSIGSQANAPGGRRLSTWERSESSQYMPTFTNAL